MNLNNKFIRRMFRRISNLVWDVTTGTAGLKTENGIYTLTREGENFGISVNPLDLMSVDIPAFATQVARSDINVGDLIVGEREIIGWVVDTTLPVALRVLDHNGNTKTYTPPTVNILGGAGPNGVLVVKNLFNLAGGQEAGANVMSQMLPLLMLSNDGGGDKLDKLFPLLLMSGGLGGASAGSNPMAAMLPLMLLSKDGGGLGGLTKDPMMLMALAGGLGGGAGGMNPMMLMALAGGLGEEGSSTPPLTRSLPVSVPPLQRR